MSIVLHESAHARQPSQSTRCLVTVDDTKFGHPDGQLLVGAVPRIKDQTMARAVHGLECPFLLLNIENEHVVLVVLPMT